MHPLPAPFVRSVFHPTDLSDASDRAFAHALAIALIRQTKLFIFHAGGDPRGEWKQFPPVRKTLERWGLLKEGSARSDVMEELSVGVSKIHAVGDPVQACFEEIKRRAPELVVLATEGRDGLARWLRPSVAQRIARRSQAMTLFVPNEGRGFVDLENGRLTLRRILVPVADTPDAHGAIVRATRAAEAFGDGAVPIRLLRVGGDPVLPRIEPSDAWTLEPVRAEGDVIDEILRASEDADMLVMPTDGRDGVLDAFRGSHTERILRGAALPVLAVPSV